MVRIRVKKAIFSITLLVVVIAALNMADLPKELRFEETKYNYLFVMVLCILLPLSLILTSLNLKERANRYGCLAVSLLLILPASFLYMVVSTDYDKLSRGAVDGRFEKIDEIEVGESKYRLYRTNGGATTAFGLVLRKESAISEHINVVEVIFSKYQAAESTLRLIDKNSIELQIEPYSKDEHVQVVELKI